MRIPRSIELVLDMLWRDWREEVNDFLDRVVVVTTLATGAVFSFAWLVANFASNESGWKALLFLPMLGLVILFIELWRIDLTVISGGAILVETFRKFINRVAAYFGVAEVVLLLLIVVPTEGHFVAIGVLIFSIVALIYFGTEEKGLPKTMRAIAGFFMVASILYMSLDWAYHKYDEMGLGASIPTPPPAASQAVPAPREQWVIRSFQSEEEYRENKKAGLEKNTAAIPANPIFDNNKLLLVTYLFQDNELAGRLVTGTIDPQAGTFHQPSARGTVQLIDHIPGAEYRWRWTDQLGQSGITVLRKEVK